MLGIDQFVVAVNKMDLVGFKKKTFLEVEASLHQLFLDEKMSYRIIPVSGLSGDNIVKPSQRMAWWSGDTVLKTLEGFVAPHPPEGDSIFSVQYVQRIPGGGRRYLGSLLAGSIENGVSVSSQRYPGKVFRVIEIVDSGLVAVRSSSPSEIGITLDTDVDLERGDVLGQGLELAHTDQFEADLVWLDEAQGFTGRTYLLRLGHATSKTTLTRLFGISDTEEKTGVLDHVVTNQIVRANLETHTKLSLATFGNFPALGRFVLVDQDSGNTVASGIINHTLRRADNITEHVFDVDSSDRSALTGQEGKVAWFTGLSGSGKSTIANATSVELRKRGLPHAILDGDTLRLGLNRDLGFSEPDRVENIRRTAEVAKMMADSGLIVLVSLISPYRADREHAKEIVGPERFVEVFVDTPLEVCESRDPKGLYQKARKGLIPNFTGIGAPYEEPLAPDYRVDHHDALENSVPAICELMRKALPN
jgi:bifunctional enzyme CysN/CysC